MYSKLYQFTLNDIDGRSAPLSQFKGKAILFVNVASRCGYTPQYSGLEAVYQKYKDRGFVVLGFPCNQFAAEEPGSDAEIKLFCQAEYGVSFPMFSKIEVNGPGKHPLYAYLSEETEFKGDIDWNFAKFLADKDGNIVARWKGKIPPQSEGVIAAIEGTLKN